MNMRTTAWIQARMSQIVMSLAWIYSVPMMKERL